MEVLSRFQSVDDLVDKVDILFSRLDADGSGELGFAEMSDGLHGIIPKMYLSLENMIDLKQSLEGDDSDQGGHQIAGQSFGPGVSSATLDRTRTWTGGGMGTAAYGSQGHLNMWEAVPDIAAEAPATNMLAQVAA